jgi:3-phosphoshikimate 1-carboxyvinyltransferase
MPLPDLIEIVPPDRLVRAEITVPGSKSITNRTLVLAALAEGETVLRGALWSEDTQLMVEALRRLQFQVRVSPDPAEPCNRLITLQGQGGRIPEGGTLEKPLEIEVGNAGTAARFLTALLCLGSGVYRIAGTRRMHERPQEPLFDALRELGYCLDSVDNRLPVLIHGGGARPGTCCVSVGESSQFASALILCAQAGGWRVCVVGDNVDELPYVTLTTRLLRAFPARGGVFLVEPDASSGSYFWAADALRSPVLELNGQITVSAWPASGWQIDEQFPRFIPLPDTLSRRRHLGDSIMTAIVLAPFADHATTFADLGRLRLQECERVRALRSGLTRCGAEVIEKGDTLHVTPSPLHGAEIETYEDHRVAMCFAILGLKVPGIKIKNPACVKKTFPDFFQKLAATPPAGLGVTLRDAGTGQTLAADSLFAY